MDSNQHAIMAELSKINDYNKHYELFLEIKKYMNKTTKIKNLNSTLNKYFVNKE